LKLLYLGYQWKELLIKKNKTPGPEVGLGEDGEESFHGNSAPRMDRWENTLLVFN
jgi:hypothetical protein